VVEALLAQNGFNMGLHRPNFVSALSEYVLMTELQRNCKVPKFTKFVGETNESTVEHIARYLTKAGDIANNENLKMKYFPSSITKNAFTWFTTLPPHSSFSWNQLEKDFHEQFYMGQYKISLKELASVWRKTHESIDDYLNRFRLLNARCFTIVPEHELVEMAVGDLDYSIRKKLDTQYLIDMTQLADRVSQVERLKAEKARTNRFVKKEIIAYVDTYGSDPGFDWGSDTVEDNEINLVEIKDGPPYACKLLRPLNGKKILKNQRMTNTLMRGNLWSFSCDGIILVPKNLKLPPLEQRKKKGFCKLQGFLGHNLCRCTRFRDSVQKVLDEGMLKFGEKSKQPMQVDADPIKKTDSMFVDVADINMVEISEEIVAGNFVETSMPKEKFQTDTEMVTEDHQSDNAMVTEDQFVEKMKVACNTSFSQHINNIQ